MRKLTGKLLIITLLSAMLLTVFIGLAAAVPGAEDPEDPPASVEASSEKESSSSKESSEESSKASSKESSEESSKESSKESSSKASSQSSSKASSKKSNTQSNDGRDLSSTPGASHNGAGLVSGEVSKASSRTAVAKNVGGIENTLNKWAWLPIVLICVSLFGMVAINVRAYRRNHAEPDETYGKPSGRTAARGKGAEPQSTRRRTPQASSQAPQRRRPPDRGGNIRKL